MHPHGGCGLKWKIRGLRRNFGTSSPARGMWIEMTAFAYCLSSCQRHPPHGGYGLKSRSQMPCSLQSCHPPHGGCGLKCLLRRMARRTAESSPTRGITTAPPRSIYSSRSYPHEGRPAAYFLLPAPRRVPSPFYQWIRAQFRKSGDASHTH